MKKSYHIYERLKQLFLNSRHYPPIIVPMKHIYMMKHCPRLLIYYNILYTFTHTCNFEKKIHLTQERSIHLNFSEHN